MEEGNVEESCSSHGSQKAKKRNRKGPGPMYTFQRHAPSEPLPPSKLHVPQFYHLPIVYSNFECISGINY
jgi:hypothetical protein